jgi:hypothetical protein
MTGDIPNTQIFDCTSLLGRYRNVWQEETAMGGLTYVGALAAAGTIVASGGSFGATLNATTVGGG